MSRWQKIALWLGFLGVAAVAAYLWLAREEPQLAERLVARLPPAVTGKDLRPPVAAPTLTPQSSPAESSPPGLVDPDLPALGASDAEAFRALASLAGGEAAPALLVQRDLLRRFVTTVDQFTGSKLPLKTRVWAPLAGAFEIDQTDPELRVGRANAARYQPLVSAFLAIEPTAAVQVYRRWYPLLQAAYAESTGTQRLFQARLLEVLEHLCAIQVPEASPALVLAEGRYRYADPALEQESVGRKALLRLGAEEAAKVQQRLGEYRALLAQPPR